MGRGVKIFSLFLLILLVLCSFSSAYAENTDYLADGFVESNLNKNINQICLESDAYDEEGLMHTDLIEEESLVESRSLDEETYGDDAGKSYRDMYMGIVLNEDNFTLADDYTFNPDLDLSLTVLSIPDYYENYLIDGQGHTIDAANSARFFMISGNNVTLRNINFINGNSSRGPLIHFSMS